MPQMRQRSLYFLPSLRTKDKPFYLSGIGKTAAGFACPEGSEMDIAPLKFV